jgi:hypothetical protein
MVLGVTAIIAAMVVWFMSALQSAGLRQGDFAKKREFIRMVSTVKAQIQDPLLCSQIMNGAAISPDASAGPPSLSNLEPGYQRAAIQLKLGENGQNLAAGWLNGTSDADSSLRLADVQVRTLDTTVRSVRFDRAITAGFASGRPATFTTYKAMLYLIPEMKRADGKTWTSSFVNLGDVDNPNIDEYRVTFYANVIDNHIYSCYTDASPAQICEMAGGGFDPFEHEPRYRCNPDHFCTTDRTGIIAAPATCAPPFSPVTMGQSEGVDQISCSWCWDGVKSTSYPLDL